MNVRLRYDGPHPELRDKKEVDRLISKVEASLERNFSCPRCGRKGGQAEQLAMAGTGLSRVLGVRQFCYVFVSCTNCGYTETYNLRTLEAQANPDILIENLFAS